MTTPHPDAPARDERLRSIDAHIQETLDSPLLSADLKKIRLMALHALRAGVASEEPEIKKAALQEASVWASLHLGEIMQRLERLLDSHRAETEAIVPHPASFPHSPPAQPR